MQKIIKKKASQRVGEEAKRALFEFVSCTAGTEKYTCRTHAEEYSHPHTDITEKAEESLEVTAGSESEGRRGVEDKSRLELRECKDSFRRTSHTSMMRAEVGGDSQVGMKRGVNSGQSQEVPNSIRCHKFSIGD